MTRHEIYGSGSQIFSAFTSLQSVRGKWKNEFRDCILWLSDSIEQ